MLIVVYHEIGLYYSSDLTNYFSILGLGLFTLGSGYRFHMSYSERKPENTVLKYSIKRFKRLYKPYIGYSLLVLPFLYITWVLVGYSDRSALLVSNITSPQSWILFLIGDNFIAGQLWYLVLLLLVNILIAWIAYNYHERLLPWLCLPMFLIAYLITNFGTQYLGLNGFLFDFVLRIPIYSIVFILGILLARSNQDHDSPSVSYWIGFLTIAFVILGQNSQFILPILAFIILCLMRNVVLLNRENFLSKNSFNIYLFHMPLLLGGVSILFVDKLGLNNPIGYGMAIAVTIFLCPIVYGFTKRLRLNRLFE